MRPRIARVSQAAATILRAGLKSIDGNKRIYAGLWLLSVIGPLSGFVYRVFDPKDYDPAGYYGGPYWYFFAICPALSSAIIFAGWYLIARPLIGRNAYSLIVPIGYHIARIIAMSMANDNVEFHYMGWTLLASGILTAALWIFLFDFLMNLHFHKREGTIARITGLIDAPGIPDEMKLKLMSRENAKLKTL